MIAAAAKRPRTKGSPKSRAARRAAVQALYQLEMSDAPAAQVVEEFRRHRMRRADVGQIDRDLFSAIVEGTSSRREALTVTIAGALAERWSFDRLDKVQRAVLLACAYELAARDGIPARAAVAEYVSLAREFLGEDEARLANGVLDRLARHMRPEEFAGAEGGDGEEPRPGTG